MNAHDPRCLASVARCVFQGYVNEFFLGAVDAVSLFGTSSSNLYMSLTEIERLPGGRALPSFRKQGSPEPSGSAPKVEARMRIQRRAQEEVESTGCLQSPFTCGNRNLQASMADLHRCPVYGNGRPGGIRTEDPRGIRRKKFQAGGGKRNEG